MSELLLICSSTMRTVYRRHHLQNRNRTHWGLDLSNLQNHKKQIHITINRTELYILLYPKKWTGTVTKELIYSCSVLLIEQQKSGSCSRSITLCPWSCEHVTQLLFIHSFIQPILESLLSNKGTDWSYNLAPTKWGDANSSLKVFLKALLVQLSPTGSNKWVLPCTFLL